MVSSYLNHFCQDGYLTSVWTGLPGVETADFKIDTDEYINDVFFYNEVEENFITDCSDSDSGLDVFQNFATKIVAQDFNCSNVCNPIWLEPILDTIDSGIIFWHNKILNQLFTKVIICSNMYNYCARGNWGNPHCCLSSLFITIKRTSIVDLKT